jgi:hypothetical protein
MRRPADWWSCFDAFGFGSKQFFSLKSTVRQGSDALIASLDYVGSAQQFSGVNKTIVTNPVRVFGRGPGQLDSLFSHSSSARLGSLVSVCSDLRSESTVSIQENADIGSDLLTRAHTRLVPLFTAYP